MRYVDFLAVVVDKGIVAACRDYAKDDAKREGSVAGFTACRGLHPGDLAILVADAQRRTDEKRAKSKPGADILEYWRARCFAAEVEWTCNVVGSALSVVAMRRKLQLPDPFVEWVKTPVLLSTRGAVQAAAILSQGQE